MKDWILTLAITGIGALVNIAINVLCYTFLAGRKIDSWDRGSRLADEHELRIEKLERWQSAATGVANGIYYRPKGD